MREILFRGKRTDSGEWVDGNLFVDEKNEKHEIIVGYVNYRIAWEVVPETVGQYTGGTDKNDRKIFEGDIVRVHDYLAKRGDPWHEFEGVVGHQNASFVIISDVVKHYRWIDYECEIIGNIHDNPELLEDKP